MAKHSSDIRVAYPEVKFQVWDLAQVVGIIAPLPHFGGVNIQGKFDLLTSRVKMGTWDLCRVPPGAVRHGRTRRSSGTGPCGYWRSVLWIPGTRGLYSFETFETRGTRLAGRPVAKRSSDPRRDRVWIAGIVTPFATRGVSIQVKFVLSRPRG